MGEYDFPTDCNSCVVPPGGAKWSKVIGKYHLPVVEYLFKKLWQLNLQFENVKITSEQNLQPSGFLEYVSVDVKPYRLRLWHKDFYPVQFKHSNQRFKLDGF